MDWFDVVGQIALVLSALWLAYRLARVLVRVIFGRRRRNP